jgi:acetoin:2,6-dichlorophenolindophenol oxidoreductase subunit beta
MAEILYREAVVDAIDEEMARDENVFLLGEDIGFFGGPFATTKGLFEKYGPKRLMDTPISETAIVGAALGCALTGLRPIAELMFIDFTGVCMDQIANQVAKARYMSGGQVEVPMVIRTQGGAGRSFAAQHSQSLEAWFMHVPGLKVVLPATPADAKGLMKSAIREDCPVMFIEHKQLFVNKGEVPEGEYLTPIGVADIKREGTDVSLISYSRMVLRCLEAADILMEKGINAEVVDLRTVDPLDMDTLLGSVAKTNKAVIVYEGYKNGGVGAEVAARLANEGFDLLDAPVKRVAGLDTPIPFNQQLERAVIPEVSEIVRHTLKLFK